MAATMNQTSSSGNEAFNIHVPSFFQQESSSTVGLIASTLFAAFAITILYQNVLFSKLSVLGRYWNETPTVANKEEWFSDSKAKERSVVECREMMIEGYKKYSKKGKAFMLPLKGNDPMVILPPSEFRTLLGKPKSELDEVYPHDQMIQREYTVQNTLLKENEFHVDLVRRDLTRKLPLLTNDVYSELCHAMRTIWSDDSSKWSTCQVYTTNMRIVSRAANRVFAGSQLCRNDEFLEHSKLYAQEIFGSASDIRLWPSWIRPVIAPYYTYANRRNIAICHKHAEPVIRERLDHTIKKMEDPSYEWEEPTDMLQWLVESSFKQGDSREVVPSQICIRMLQLNMAAIHTTSMMMTHTILDLYSSPRAKEYIAGLREECDRVLQKYNGDWSKNAVNELVRIDSTIRESMRFTGLGNIGLERLVVSESGVDFGHGIHVPKGATVGLPLYNMHHDDDIYPNADTYDAFRFSNAREAFDAGKSEDLQRTLDFKNQALVAVGDNFMAFGNGRHACPGRFFAAQEMKLMLAEIVTNYDIELVDEGRPANIPTMTSHMPPPFAEMKVKRRS